MTWKQPENTALRADVASLLASASDASASLRDAITAGIVDVSRARADAWIGRRFGPYRLVERIGEGGMGIVFLAERDDAEFHQTVAIKVVQHELASPQAIARFRDERQILAALEHPGIVRLLDGGTTNDGLPYLVMERVDGVPLIAYARERALSVRARIELVRQVCAALEHAHGQHVVHRDIKPSNILVAASGAPKLLDFGIAKLVAPDAAREARTRTGMALGRRTRTRHEHDVVRLGDRDRNEVRQERGARLRALFGHLGERRVQVEGERDRARDRREPAC